MATDPKRLLAALVPAAGDQEVSDTKPDPEAAKNQSPVLGDHAFYTYFVPGAVFEAKDGTQWDVENIADTGYTRIRTPYVSDADAARVAEGTSHLTADPDLLLDALLDTTGGRTMPDTGESDNTPAPLTK